MKDEKYNGWTNYETWAVNLWLTSEKGSDSYWREQARDQYEKAEPSKYSTKKEVALGFFSQQIKEELAEANPLAGEASLWADLLGGALSEVDWYEIAEAFMKEFGERAE